MQVAEVMMIAGVQLNQRMVGTVDIGVIKSRAARETADIGDLSLKNRALIELFLIGRFHILSAPADVPDRRDEIRWRRLVHFVEQQPDLARTHGIAPVVLRLLAFEVAGVKLDSRGGIGGIQMHVIEMNVLPRGDGTGEQGECRSHGGAIIANSFVRRLVSKENAKDKNAAGRMTFSVGAFVSFAF